MPAPVGCHIPPGSDEELERALGYFFRDPRLLDRALTHPSAAQAPGEDYERLEFLGDAVLDLAIADFLMSMFPTEDEGTLSRLRASLVNGRTLAAKATEIGVGARLRLGKGEEKNGGRNKVSILAGAFEALIGAIYLDDGLESARRTVEQLFASEIGGPSAERDYKTAFQELAHRHFRTHPVYELIAERGPKHAKWFVSRVRVGKRELGVGEGGSKKQSEQAAARAALENLKSSLLDDGRGSRKQK